MAHIPKPFSRPSISLNTSGRRWVQTRAWDLDTGDIVQDMGMVKEIEKHVTTTKISFASGLSFVFTNDTVMRAFTLGESVGISL
jgi:prolyl oligopeptidase PreP (S9A serine peptidase family)